MHAQGSSADGLLTVQEVAEWLGVEPHTVMAEVGAGKLFREPGGRTPRFAQSEVEDYWRRNTNRGDRPLEPYVPRSQRSNTPTSLYRFYDADGQLLYVGVTSQGVGRFRSHATNAPWWTQAVRTELEHFDTRLDAEREERRQIKALRPIHNVRHAERAIERAKVAEAA